MADRQRTTWASGDKAATSSQPVLPVERARAASAHPATPDEGAGHPAHQPDPTQPADYENGDTSSWAEDPTTGPYPNSAHPATPDEGAGHPAHRGDQVAKAAAHELRASVERKAAKCIRISSAMLGPKATIAAIEDQALDLMDMSDSAIQASLSRLAEDAEDAEDEDEDDGKKAADERLLRRLLAEEDADEDEDDGKKAADERLLRRLLAEEDDEDEDDGKKAVDKSGNAEILAALEAIGGRLSALEGGNTTASDDELLANLLAEEGDGVGGGEDGDVDAMLMSMLDEPTPDEPTLDTDDELDMNDLGIDMGLVEDPMGLLGEVEMSDDEDALLAQLFADDNSRYAGGDSDDEDEEDDGKKAATMPRPKKASRGTPRLGRQTKEATSKTASDIKELEKLWPTAPDVTGVFG